MRPIVFRVAVLVAVLGLVTAASGQVSPQAYIKASNTESFDRFGTSIAVSGNTMVIGALGEDSSAVGVNGEQGDNGADNSGAVYVFVRDGTGWTQAAYLKASNTEPGDSFKAVAISGDTLVVGASGEDSSAVGVNGEQSDNAAENSGAVYVFVRDGDTWTQTAYLKASNTDAGDVFGSSVSISGNTLVVGADWESSGATGVDGVQDDDSEPNAGAAYVFVRDGSTWTQSAYLKASNTGEGDRFGHSVAVSGDTVVVGAYLEDSSLTGVDNEPDDDSASAAGATYVFVLNGTTWSQQAWLKASNTDAGDRFGTSVAVSGDTIVIGATLEDSSATGVDGDETDNGIAAAGAGYVFARSGTSWSQQAYLKSSNTENGDWFGESVAVSGDTIIVGAHLEDSDAVGVDGDQGDASAGVDSGAAYVYARNGTSWSQQAYLKASNTSRSDHFGEAVAASTEMLVIGARDEGSDAIGPYDDSAGVGAESAGAAYVFDAAQTGVLMVVGDGPGAARFFGVGHVFETQLDAVEDSYPVLPDDIPEFVVPLLVGRRDVRGTATLGNGTLPATPLGNGALGTTPAWMLDGDFAVQVLMWNPEDFPGQPEQYTAGLYVSIQSDGSVFTTPYGDDVGGMAIWHELDTNAAGQRVIRFPFSIPGF